MNEREREGFIRKIGISADDTDESDDDEENSNERHKYNCKKCQVSLVSRTATHTFKNTFLENVLLSRGPLKAVH